MIFKIVILGPSCEGMFSPGQKKEVQIKGRNLVELTRKLQHRWDISAPAGRIVLSAQEERCISNKSIKMRGNDSHYHVKKNIDWTSQEALEFMQTITAIKCHRIVLINFLCFPQSLIEQWLVEHGRQEDSFVGLAFDQNARNDQEEGSWSSDVLSSTNSPFWGKLSLYMGRPIDWDRFALWLDKTSFCRATGSCLQNVEVYLDEACVQESNECQRGLAAILCSLATKSLRVIATYLPCSRALLESVQSNDFLEKLDVAFSDIELTTLITTEKRSLHIEADDETNWLALLEWLEALAFCHAKRCWDELTLTSCFTNNEIPRAKQAPYLKCLKTMKSLEFASLEVESYGEQWFISDILNQSLESNRAFQSIVVNAEDCRWIDFEMIQALKRNTVVEKLEITSFSRSDFQPETMKKIHTVLESNCSIWDLSLKKYRGCNLKSVKLTPEIKMYLGLNRNHKRKILQHGRYYDNMYTSEEWIWLLEACKQQPSSRDKVKDDTAKNSDAATEVSCIYYILRDRVSYYIPLFH